MTVTEMESKVLYIVCFTLAVIQTCHSLECYVCSDQEDNNQKCTTSLKICEQHEDVCLTEIRWGSTPYWSHSAIKQFYISKKCSTKTDCVKYRQRNMPYCTHIWYEDWTCSECCQGDRCNYFIISGAESVTKNILLTLSLAILTTIKCL